MRACRARSPARASRPRREIMRALDRGEEFIVTRNGVPVGELRPFRKRRFVLARRCSRCLRAPRGSTTSSSSRPRPVRRSGPRRVPEHPRGVLDTSVVVDIESVDGQQLPPSMAISAITLAELTAGPHAARSRLARTTAGRATASGGHVQLCRWTKPSRAPTSAYMPPRGLVASLAVAAHSTCSSLRLRTDLPVHQPERLRGLENLLEVVQVGPPA